MLVVLDNYDSFTYNLVAAFRALGAEVRVLRSDQTTTAEVMALRPQGLIISPGPGQPTDAGQCPAILAAVWGQVPLLGICLGHQLIAHHAGGRVVAAQAPVHGKTSPLRHTGTGWFAGVAQHTPVMRYHSLVAEAATLPADLVPIAWADDTGEIMAIAHRHLPILGVQFHPESVLTPEGPALLERWWRSTTLTPVNGTISLLAPT
ncbi:MAG: aminodeoxychorismate/anthranilate synthase component II [Bacteroidia bacterium]|nr:aminodeoxychorismate/anthranilate synthase component II [Bacteroidia bacterium]